MCTDCGGTVIEYDAAAGNGFCVNCGTVVEENTIVNEVRRGLTVLLLRSTHEPLSYSRCMYSYIQPFL